MKVKDFLENFEGTNHIKIYDRFSFQTQRYNDVRNAIADYGYFTVRNWTISENVLIITIQSEF